MSDMACCFAIRRLGSVRNSYRHPTPTDRTSPPDVFAAGPLATARVRSRPLSSIRLVRGGDATPTLLQCFRAR